MLIRKRCSVMAVPVFLAMVSTVFAQADSEPNVVELVRAVRRSERWLDDCNSLHLCARAHWTKTPEWLAKRRLEIIEEFGVEDPNEAQFSDLRKTSETTMETAVDQRHVRYLTNDPGYWRQLKVWDSNELRIHEKYFLHDQEHYCLDNKLDERMYASLLSSHFGWPRSQPHSFWYSR